MSLEIYHAGRSQRNTLVLTSSEKANDFDGKIINVPLFDVPRIDLTNLPVAIDVAVNDASLCCDTIFFARQYLIDTRSDESSRKKRAFKIVAVQNLSDPDCEIVVHARHELLDFQRTPVSVYYRDLDSWIPDLIIAIRRSSHINLWIDLTHQMISLSSLLSQLCLHHSYCSQSTHQSRPSTRRTDPRNQAILLRLANYAPRDRRIEEYEKSEADYYGRTKPTHDFIWNSETHFVPRFSDRELSIRFPRKEMPKIDRPLFKASGPITGRKAISEYEEGKL